MTKTKPFGAFSVILLTDDGPISAKHTSIKSNPCGPSAQCPRWYSRHAPHTWVSGLSSATLPQVSLLSVLLGRDHRRNKSANTGINRTPASTYNTPGFKLILSRVDKEQSEPELPQEELHSPR
ncbi:hypothetical protein J6590_027333 [Homalodisca vitripennis]|nr:hypothetical protein J6590_027333 [Homalodisca vitripennis]